MKDYLGHELAVGDLVMMGKGTTHGFDLHFGRVMRFTPKMVNVDYLVSPQHPYVSNMSKSPGGLMKVLAITPEVQVWLDMLNRACVERLKREPV